MPGMVAMRKAQPKRQGRSLTRHQALPIIIGNETGLHAIPGVWPCYRGIFTGHSVLVTHLDDATSLHTMGCFGKPSTSKFNTSKPTIFRRRQYKLREEWRSRVPVSNTNTTSKTDSDSSTCDSSDDDSCNDIQVESIRPSQKRVWEKQSDDEDSMSEHDDVISRCWYGSNWDSENIQPVYKKYKSSNNSSNKHTKKSDINNRLSSDDEITILSDSETSNRVVSPTSPDILLIPNEKENKNPNELVIEDITSIDKVNVDKNTKLHNEEPEIINLDEAKEGTSNNSKEVKLNTDKKEEVIIDITSPVKEVVSEDINNKVPSIVCKVLDFASEDISKNNTVEEKEISKKSSEEKEKISNVSQVSEKEDSQTKDKEIPLNDENSTQNSEENSQKSQNTDEMSDSSEQDFHLHLSQSEDENSNSSQKQSTSKPHKVLTLNETQSSSNGVISKKNEVTDKSEVQKEAEKLGENLEKSDKDKLVSEIESNKKESEKLCGSIEKFDIIKESTIKVSENGIIETNEKESKKLCENIEKSDTIKETNEKEESKEKSEVIEESNKKESEKTENKEKSDVIKESNAKELKEVSDQCNVTKEMPREDKNTAETPKIVAILKETPNEDKNTKEMPEESKSSQKTVEEDKIPQEITKKGMTEQSTMEVESSVAPQEDKPEDDEGSLDMDICNMPITESGDYEAPEDVSIYQEGRDCIVIDDSDCEGDKEELIKKWCPDFVKSTWNACDESLVLSLEETFFLTWSLGCLNVTAPQSLLLQLLPPLHQSEHVNNKDKPCQDDEVSVVASSGAQIVPVSKTSNQKDDDEVCVVGGRRDADNKKKEAEVSIIHSKDSEDIIMLDMEEPKTTSNIPQNSMKDIITVDMDTSESKDDEENKSSEIVVLSDQESESKSIVSLDQEPSQSNIDLNGEVKTVAASQESKQKSVSPQPGPSGMQNLQKIAQVYGLKDEGNGEVVLLPSVLWGLSCRQPNFPSRYVAYHHFRSLGWVVRSGIKFGGDFLLYQHGPNYNHATYVVMISRSSTPVSWQKIMTTNRIAEVTRKGVLLCYIEWPQGEETFDCLSKVNVKVRTISRPKIGRDQSRINSNIQHSSSDGTDTEVSD